MELEGNSGSRHHRGGSRRGGAAISQELRAPRGYYTVLGTILAGALLLIAHALLRHADGGAPILTGPQPVITITAVPSTSASPAGPAPVGRGAPPSSGAIPAARTAAPPRSHAVTALPSAAPGRTPPDSAGPTPPAPTPTPSPSEPAPSAPLPLTVAATVAVPTRGAPLLAARAVVTSGAPPFPIGVSASFTLLSPKTSIALP